MTSIRRGTAFGMDSPRASSWADRTACGPHNAAWFDLSVSDGSRQIRLTVENRLALELCANCPVQPECLEHELNREDPWPRIAGGEVLGVGDKTKARLRPPCGTNSGYERHRRNGEPKCQPCCAAHSAYTMGRLWARRTERRR